MAMPSTAHLGTLSELAVGTPQVLRFILFGASLSVGRIWMSYFWATPHEASWATFIL